MTRTGQDAPEPAWPTEGEIILETDAVLVRRRPRASPVCVVTFGHYTDRPALVRTGFGEAVLHATGIDAIHVISRRNDWFQHPDMATAAAAIRAALAGKPAVTYGSSMGGYGAIRFAGAIGARRALALSPQYTLDRRIVPFERRWLELSRTVRFLDWPEVKAPPPAIVIYDPDDPDARHVALWAAARPVVGVPLRRIGHPATSILAELGLLLPVLTEVIEDRFDAAALARRFRAARHGSAEYLASLSDAQPPHRAACRIALMRRAACAAPTRPHLASRLAMLLYRAGEDAEAEAEHRRAVALDPEDVLLRFRYSRFLQRLGRYDAALEEARLAVAARPESVPLARHLRRLQCLAGRPGPVREARRVANALTRRLDRLYWGRRRNPFGRLGQP